MKKILFLVKHPQYFHAPIFKEAAKKLNIELDIREYDQLTITYRDKVNELLFGKTKLSDYHLVFFRTIGSFSEEAILISEYCATHNIPVIDSVFNHQSPWIDKKSFEYQRLANQNLPIINSYFVSKRSFLEMSDTIQYPIIAKITDGSKGEGVYKCNKKEDILEIFDKEKKSLLIQDFVKNDGDIRVFIIGDKIIGAIKRTNLNKNEFRNNISLGGSADIYKLNDEEKDIALSAAKAMKYEIVGVDLVKDESGNIYIIEVNRAPQFNGFMKATNIDVAYKIIEFLKTKCM